MSNSAVRVAVASRSFSRHPTLRAELLARVYGVFALKCSGCGGRVRLIGFITEPATVRLYWRMLARQQLHRQVHLRAHHRLRRMHSS